MAEMKYKIVFKVDTELESDDCEENRMLASYLQYHLFNKDTETYGGADKYHELLKLINNFYKELP